MLSKEPPSVAKYSSRVLPMFEEAREEFGIILVASCAPPNIANDNGRTK